MRIGLWDGNVENHVDFGNRLHVLEFEYSLFESGGHGVHAAGTIAGAGLLNPKARGIAPGEKILLRVNNFAGDTKAKISYDGGRSYEYISQVKSFYSTFLRLPKGAKTMRETKIRLNDGEGRVLVNRHPFTIAGQLQKL